MSLSGILNGHFVTAWLIETFGNAEQHDRWLPQMATGKIRAAFAMTEPHAGSDLQSIRTRAERDGDEYVVTGEKTWITNALRATLLTLLVKTNPTADPPHRGTSTLVVERAPEEDVPGLAIAPLAKLGYKGLETCSVAFDGLRVPAANLLGEEGAGFRQFMAGIQPGRVNIAAAASGSPRRRSTRRWPTRASARASASRARSTRRSSSSWPRWRRRSRRPGS